MYFKIYGIPAFAGMVLTEYSNKSIKLGVLKVNNRARMLYEKLGFEICGEENHHFQMIYVND